MNKNKAPLISVITVCYNAVDVLEKTILSVINQTYPSIEYIIIDGGSKDGTVDIIKKYSEHISFWISEPDNGIYYAMNKGIECSKGEWINFMNAGDLFYNNSVLSDVFTKSLQSKIKVVYGKTLAKYYWGSYIVTPPAISMLIQRMCLCHQSLFIRTSYHKEHLYNTTIGLAADYNFLYHCYSEFPDSFLFSSSIISIYDAIEGVSAKRVVDTEYEISKISGYKSWKTMIKNKLSGGCLITLFYRCYLFFHPRFERVD